MTEVQNVTFSYGEKIIFRNFSHIFAENRITALMGPSGVGKTTLLRLISGLLVADSGRIQTDSPFSMLFQEPRLCPRMSISDNLRLVLGGKEALPMARKWLERVHLESDADRRPRELSGGMLQRAALARTLAYAEHTDCRLVLLDEPFKGLDVDLHDEMLSLIKTATAGRTVILVTHDPGDSERLADEVLNLEAVK
ncbi:MAG: ATP-binding cassette domain-containing protein [Eubacteriales bacterium]